MPETWEVVVAGTTDADVQTAVTSVLSGRAGNAVQKKLIFPPGTYNLTQPLLPAAAPVEQIEGLTIEGLSMRSTKINWNGTGRFIDTTNRHLRFFTLRNFTFASTSAAREFAYLYSTAAIYNQGFLIENCEWQGSWLRVFGLDGDATANLNSEFILRRLYTATDSVYADAFFRSGGISGPFNQQNQFLNYWIEDCILVTKSGTMFRFDKGGSINVVGGSYSAANSTDGPITWFHMPNAASNNRSAAQLKVSRVRFEPKASNHAIIDCAWGTGSVTFEDCCDLGSIQNNPAAYGWALHKYTGQNPWGWGGTLPAVRYARHQHAGCVSYAGAAGVPGRGGSLVFDQCYVNRGPNGEMANAVAVDGANPALVWSSGAPKYAFTRCDGITDETNM